MYKTGFIFLFTVTNYTYFLSLYKLYFFYWTFSLCISIINTCLFLDIFLLLMLGSNFQLNMYTISGYYL